MVDMNAVETIRTTLGVPKSRIAEKCNITVNTYDNWLENPGQIKAVSAKALADALLITDSERLIAIFFAPNVQENVSK